MSIVSKQMLLVNYPVGKPKLDDFKLVETPLPEIKNGEALIKTIYFSLDPYMRGRMSQANSYAEGYKLGEVMYGGAVCVVEQSKNPLLNVGDLVSTFTGWQTHAVLNDAAIKMTQKPPKEIKPSLSLGALGMPGFTAYHGLMKIGEPKAGETVVVAAATGPVGSMVGQLAKLKGCRVVGIAGGSEKCAYAVSELGFDVCLDHKSATFKDDLKNACPKGIDIYFENVGGMVFDAVRPLLNIFARVPLCGFISAYNQINNLKETGFSTSILLEILIKRMRVQGFIISDHFNHINEFLNEVAPMVLSGKIKFKEDFVKGIENAPAAFIGMLEGKNFGKLIIEI